MKEIKPEEWIQTHTFHHSSFSDIKHLVDLKEEKGLKISLAFPTFNEEDTIGQEVRVVREKLQKEYPLLNEVAVIDSGSTDNTREVAREAGADVYLADDYLSRFGVVRGKGENLWKSLYLLEGDIIVWIDADIKNIHPKFVYGPVGPLLEHDHIEYVKSFYERPLKLGTRMRQSGGGRVTEIMARPLLGSFYPGLSAFAQPLSGEYAGRRGVLEAVPFRVGYGVEIGLLIDIYERFGLKSLAQVDLDKRVHRNQGLPALRRMSFAILHTFLTRLQEHGIISPGTRISKGFEMIRGKGRNLFLEREEFALVERPPMITVEEYRRKRGIKEK